MLDVVDKPALDTCGYALRDRPNRHGDLATCRQLDSLTVARVVVS